MYDYSVFRISGLLGPKADLGKSQENFLSATALLFAAMSQTSPWLVKNGRGLLMPI
jgi:hypothetical protein